MISDILNYSAHPLTLPLLSLTVNYSGPHAQICLPIHVLLRWLI